MKSDADFNSSRKEGGGSLFLRIDFSASGDSRYDYDLVVVIYVGANAIIADEDASQMFVTGQFLAAGWPWVSRQSILGTSRAIMASLRFSSSLRGRLRLDRILIRAGARA